MIKQVSLFLILFFLLSPKTGAESIENPVPGSAQTNLETKSEEEVISERKWTETLRLRDYNVLPGSDSVTNINEYKTTLEKNYKLHPNVFSIAVEYGLLLIDSGETEKAQQVWDRAINDFVNNPTPKIYRAWVDAQKGNYKAAKDVWYYYAKEKIDTGVNTTVWLPHHADCVLGLSLIKNNLPEADRLQAEEAVNEIAKHFANNPKFASILITNDLQAGKLESARKKIKRVLQNSPNEPVIITLQGISEIIAGKYEEALKLLEKSNELNPKSPTNHLMRARALLALDRKKESNLVYKQALLLEPSLAVKGVKKGLILAERGYLTVQSKSTGIKKDKEKDIKDLKESKKEDNTADLEIN